MIKHRILSSVVVSALIALPASAHRSGCHRWHSCPSDSGSYDYRESAHKNSSDRMRYSNTVAQTSGLSHGSSPSVASADSVPHQRIDLSLFNRGINGDPESQFFIGGLYEHGDQAKVDYINAMRWYRLAADQGYAPAQFNMSMLYAGGKGVTASDKESVKWLRRATAQGLVSAQHNLSIAYALGKGVEMDIRVAYALANLASTSSSSPQNNSVGLRTQIMTYMTVSEIEAGQKLARSMAMPGNTLAAIDRFIQKP